MGGEINLMSKNKPITNCAKFIYDKIIWYKDIKTDMIWYINIKNGINWNWLKFRIYTYSQPDLFKEILCNACSLSFNALKYAAFLDISEELAVSQFIGRD